MGREATSCAVPKEAVDAGRQGLVQMVAYGHEANFVYPPRPADPKVAWNRQWEVKVRYRSATGGMLGQPMPQMGGRGGPPGGYTGAGQTGQGQPSLKGRRRRDDADRIPRQPGHPALGRAALAVRAATPRRVDSG